MKGYFIHSYMPLNPTNMLTMNAIPMIINIYGIHKNTINSFVLVRKI